MRGHGKTNAETPVVTATRVSYPDDLAATFVSDQKNFARYAAESKLCR